MGSDDAAEAVAGLQQHDVERQAAGLCLLRQAVAGGQAGDAAADDYGSLAVRACCTLFPPPTPLQG